MTKTTILIVDDFPEDQEDLISLIRGPETAFSFDTAETGDEAIAAFKRDKHDCVFIDYRLGTENGLDVLARLKEFDPFCAAIMMSGHGSEEVAADAMKSGAVDYLVKGNTSGQSIRASIQRTIRRCAEQRKASAKQQEQKQFLNTLVHDIRAPFKRISTSTAMLVEDIENGSYSDIDTLVKLQSAAVEHADALIKTLQAYALLDGDVVAASVSLAFDDAKQG